VLENILWLKKDSPRVGRSGWSRPGFMRALGDWIGNSASASSSSLIVTAARPAVLWRRNKPLLTRVRFICQRMQRHHLLHLFPCVGNKTKQRAHNLNHVKNLMHRYVRFSDTTCGVSLLANFSLSGERVALTRMYLSRQQQCLATIPCPTSHHCTTTPPINADRRHHHHTTPPH
jgi:hypothetical protein